MSERSVKIRGSTFFIDHNTFSASNDAYDRVLCLSSRDVYVLGTFLDSIALWRTRYGQHLVGELYEISTDGDYHSYFSYIRDLRARLGEKNMDCLNQGLSQIASAISALKSQGAGCCSPENVLPDTGGVNGYATDSAGNNWPILGDDPVVNLPTGTYPDGYDSMEDYQSDKCSVANLIVDGWIASLTNFGMILGGNAGATLGLVITAVTGLLVIPFAVFPMLCVALGGLLFASITLGEAITELRDHRSEIVCILYEGENASTIISLYADLLDVILAGIPGSVAIKGVLMLLCNSDTLNQLFTYGARMRYPDADCSGCGSCVPTFTLVTGEGTLLADGQARTITAVYAGYHYYIEMFNTTEDCCNAFFKIVSHTGGQPLAGSRSYDCGGTPQWSLAGGVSDGTIFYIAGDPHPPEGLYIALYSDSPFTIDLILAPADFTE